MRNNGLQFIGHIIQGGLREKRSVSMVYLPPSEAMSKQQAGGRGI